MAPPLPPVERNGGETTAGGEAQRSVPTPFLTKTFQLVDDQSIDDVISWNEDGSSFIVWNPTEFARDLLPKYFKHNNIYVLMSNYSGSNANSSNQSAESSLQSLKPLDLMPATGCGGENQPDPEETRARLFGVSIGSKRVREGEDGSAEQDHDLRLQQPGTDVKSEPSDPETGEDNEESPWLRQCHRQNQRVCN
nr:heat stress transcription factor B-2B-like [Ipomoea batatas]